MLRTFGVLCLAIALVAPAATAGDLKGDYMETRTCDVYTGPCFANGQASLTGRDAIMAWSIDRGSFQGVELAGLKVIVVLNANDTLGFGGPLNFEPDPIRSVIIVDERGSKEQRAALEKFAIEHARHAGEVLKVIVSPIEMSADHFEVVGKLKAGDMAQLVTRKVSEEDCTCRNEDIFYPPLCDVKNITPAYTVEGGYSGPGFNQKWSNRASRSAFLASFSY